MTITYRWGWQLENHSMKGGIWRGSKPRTNGKRNHLPPSSTAEFLCLPNVLIIFHHITINIMWRPCFPKLFQRFSSNRWHRWEDLRQRLEHLEVPRKPPYRPYGCDAELPSSANGLPGKGGLEPTNTNNNWWSCVSLLLVFVGTQYTITGDLIYMSMNSIKFSFWCINQTLIWSLTEAYLLGPIFGQGFWMNFTILRNPSDLSGLCSNGWKLMPFDAIWCPWSPMFWRVFWGFTVIT